MRLLLHRGPTRLYGLATNYSGVGDPSEPNYVAMLGGDTFGISDDNPYWFPGHTVSASNLPSEMEDAANMAWLLPEHALPRL